MPKFEARSSSRGRSHSTSPGPVVEVVEFPAAGTEEQIPLKELGSVLMGSKQTEESREQPGTRTEEDEVDLSEAAKATLPKYRLDLDHQLLAMIVFYFFSPRMLRSIAYGTKPRNRLDVYVPRKKWRRAGPMPTVIFITGGAWTIGYKAWGALLGRRLSQRGVLVFCLDYRNFPQGEAVDMLCDVNTGIAWVLNNAPLYGGDPGKTYIVGQSAGGHLGGLAVLAQVALAVSEKQGGGNPGGRASASQNKGNPTAAPSAGVDDGNENITTDLSPDNLTTLDESGAALPPELAAMPRWDPSQLRGFVGVSGAYNLVTLADHLNARGLNRRMFGTIMSVDGAPALAALSPTVFVERMDPAAAAAAPPVLLLHGTADASVPVDNALDFARILDAAGVAVRLRLYRGKTHTQPIVEDPMRGGRDELMDDVLELVTGTQQNNWQFPMVPAFLINLASAVCPF